MFFTNIIINQLTNLGVFFIFILFLSFLILLASLFVGPNNPDIYKVSPYECGFEPYEDARNTFNIQFYFVSILFILFDLEAAFFFPWCTSFSLLTFDGFLAMFDFILELIIGYIYIWWIGALEWR
jgi:NADH-quinone oxidoreductase subunit A